MGLRGGTSDGIAGNVGTGDVFFKNGPVFDHFLQKVQKRIKKSKNLRGNRKMGWTMFC